MQITDYFTLEQITKFYNNINRYKTPFILCNLDIIKKNYLNLLKYFSNAKIYYALKANPSNQIVNLLKQLGSNFDIASKYQLDQVLSLGILPENISYGNTIKKQEDIQYFYSKGIRLFVTDSLQDIQNIAKNAPNSKVFCRILLSNCDGADWPLSKKFGCSKQMAIQILKYAHQNNLTAYGISFHVGSQQKNIINWKSALLEVKQIFDQLETYNIKLNMINLGGGLPIYYQDQIETQQTYLLSIKQYINQIFDRQLEIIFEPGRSLVGNCGITVTQVINKTNKSIDTSLKKWIFIDAGVFNGFIQTLGESIKYPVFCYKKENFQDLQNYIIAGPTCDSMDILYEDTPIYLPKEIEIKDKLIWCQTGAYTRSYASIYFNGFPSIPIYFI